MTDPTRCPSTAELTVDGRATGAIVRCELDTGHEHAGEPHRCSLEWTDDADITASWPERYDADESFDLEVDIAPAETIREQRVATVGATVEPAPTPDANPRCSVCGLDAEPECSERRHVDRVA